MLSHWPGAARAIVAGCEPHEGSMKDPNVQLLESVNQLCSAWKFLLKANLNRYLLGCHETLCIFVFVC